MRLFGQGCLFDESAYSAEGTRDSHRRYTIGEEIRAGWVISGDFEKAPLD